MDNFNKLKSIIQSKKNAITNVFIDSETNNKSISDFAIDHHTINKDSYTLNLFTYEKSIPEKKKDATNKLDYEMKNYYFLKLYINKDDELLEITIDRSLNKKDIHSLFLDYLDKINFSTINDFFTHLIEII